jgi:hypothetical protein
MNKILKRVMEQAVGHWKTTAVGAGEAGGYIASSHALSDSPEVHGWALVFAAARFLIGLWQKDHQK